METEPGQPTVASADGSESTATVAIVTFKRPAKLARCLEAVLSACDNKDRLDQHAIGATGEHGGDGHHPPPASRGGPVVEVLVIDNDAAASGLRIVCGRPAAANQPTVRYVRETRPGVAAARNRALAEATGPILIFIDDDEIPGPGWPHGLLTTMRQTGAAMVGGPVVTKFEADPPAWVLQGRFFERKNPAHGSPQSWLRSGNVAVDLRQISSLDLRFDENLSLGEDVDFTMRAKAQGLDLRWSTSGTVVEYVESDRTTLGWRIRRERQANQAWTRVRLVVNDGYPARAELLGRGLASAVIGLVRLIGGLPTGDRAQLARGAIGIVGFEARLRALVGHRRADSIRISRRRGR